MSLLDEFDLAIGKVIGNLLFESSTVDAGLYDLLIALQKLDHHNLCLRQRQVLTNAASWTTAEDKRNHLQFLLVMLLLPPLRDKLKGLLEVFLIVKHGNPADGYA